jgi:hypothetical protein
MNCALSTKMSKIGYISLVDDSIRPEEKRRRLREEHRREEKEKGRVKRRE